MTRTYFPRHRALLALVFLVLAAALPARAAAAPVDQLPDLQTLIPTDAFSIAQGTNGPEFRYTHRIFDAGPGPLEIQPQYNQSSGAYQGFQQVYAKDSATAQWTLSKSTPVADAFVFHAAHGHFHFPMASFGLYTVAADGGIGAPVSISPKNGFCIADSYMYDTTVLNAGTFIGTQGSCADPSTLRGLRVGAVDEYDYRDPGQAIPFTGVPDGTYWFRAVTDPNNDLVEADESNNETDVKVTIANGVVTPGQVIHPDTTPPTVTMTAPSEGSRITGTVQLTATTAASGGVQFLVDGSPVGAGTNAGGNSYTYNWDTTTLLDGTHWIAARTSDSQGRVGTSSVVTVNVANNTPLPQPGVLSVDGKVSVDGHGPVTTAPLTTTQSGDVLLAFVAADGPSAGGQTVTVSGGGLQWSLVKRSNTRPGDAEIWKATAPTTVSGLSVSSLEGKSGYDQSVTVVAFASAAGVGVSSSAGGTGGAPSTSLVTTGAGSWVFGVGNDWDRAVAVTASSGQTIQHQWVNTPTGDTYWVQSQTNPTPNAGTTVPISDASLNTDRWNMASVEVLPGTAPTPDTQAPQVSVTDPAAGTTVSGIVPVAAKAADNVGVTSVQFKVDGQNVGNAVTAPPFQIQWDSRTVSQGQHTITAVATDGAGNSTTSADDVITVNNTAPPPANITIDTQVNQRARGVLTSPGLTTSGSGEQLLAFVSFDGPTTSAQTATVSGGGVTWTLVKRSNTQAGDSEIWAAKASGTLSNATFTATPAKTTFDGMLTVIAFKNAAGPNVAGASGATTGPPDIYLPGIPTGSWVFAAGNDWDKAIARTPVAGQVLPQQWLDTKSGDTFWVQSTSTPSAAPGLVTIHDDAPTTDRWNYVAVEETAAPASP